PTWNVPARAARAARARAAARRVSRVDITTSFVAARPVACRSGVRVFLWSVGAVIVRAPNAPTAFTGAARGRPPARGQSRRLPLVRIARVKTYDIEVQHLKSLKHDKGVMEIEIDALVLSRPPRDEQS